MVEYPWFRGYCCLKGFQRILVLFRENKSFLSEICSSGWHFRVPLKTPIGLTWWVRVMDYYNLCLRRCQCCYSVREFCFSFRTSLERFVCLVFPAGNRTCSSAVGGKHSRKGPFQQLVKLTMLIAIRNTFIWAHDQWRMLPLECYMNIHEHTWTACTRM